MNQFTGTLEWVSKAKRFGYLKREDGQYFAVVEPESISFGTGATVAFDIVRGIRGPEATHLTALLSERAAKRNTATAIAKPQPKDVPCRL